MHVAAATLIQANCDQDHRPTKAMKGCGRCQSFYQSPCQEKAVSGCNCVHFQVAQGGVLPHPGAELAESARALGIYVSVWDWKLSL
jgi:hypothetical protein